MDTQERDDLVRRLAEQAIAREALEEKIERIRELEAEVKYLRTLLNEAMAVPKAVLATNRPAAPKGNFYVPLRWKVR